MGGAAKTNDAFDGMSEVTNTMVKLADSEIDIFNKSNVRHDDGTLMMKADLTGGP